MADKFGKSRGKPVFKTISMTGFGNGVVQHELVTIEVELRSVNSRFLDLNFKLPRAYAQFEPVLREQLSSALMRGRIEVTVQRQPHKGKVCSLEFNRALFEAYFSLYQSLSDEFSCSDAGAKAAFLSDLLGKRELVEFADQVGDLELEKELLQQAVSQALTALTAMRESEGEKLGQNICSCLSEIQQLAALISSLVSNAPQEILQRFTERLNRLAPEITVDPLRLAAETALLADKVDITEELVRLESHFSQFLKHLSSSPNGRKLEFVLQELGREFNTIASKAQNAEVQAKVVDAKSWMEKIKEQVLNIE